MTEAIGDPKPIPSLHARFIQGADPRPQTSELQLAHSGDPLGETGLQASA